MLVLVSVLMLLYLMYLMYLLYMGQKSNSKWTIDQLNSCFEAPILLRGKHLVYTSNTLVYVLKHIPMLKTSLINSLESVFITPSLSFMVFPALLRWFLNFTYFHHKAQNNCLFRHLGGRRFNLVIVTFACANTS